MRDAADHVLDQVAALSHQAPDTVDFEVIWVDNGSRDGTRELVERAIGSDPRMRLVSAPEIGSSYFARNRGIAVARGDRLLFCDADDVVDSHWVQTMARALAYFDVVGGALQSEAGEEPAVKREPYFGFLPAAQTANLAIRRDVLHAIGEFNGHVQSGEDIALCWRAQLHGFRFGFAPNATVLYRRRATEWARLRRIWTQGRWYRVWAGPFIPLGADAATIGASLRRLVTDAALPAVKHPRRYQARAALWHLAVLSSALWRPRQPRH